MISKTSVYLSLLISAAVSVHAVNDWSKPCFQGDCSYDVAASNTSVPASLRIWGSTSAISDVTEAGGWIILGCDKASSTQDIRLVCKSDDSTAVGCDHVHENGAEETIVRLPENCGRGPFARVARAWISEDQQVPQWAVAKIHLSGKRAFPQVHALALDTNFAQSTGAKHGPVSFALVGTSAPEDDVLDIPRETNARRAMERRGLFGSIGKVFDGAKNAVAGAAKTVEKGAAKVVTGAAKEAGSAAKSVAKGVEGAAKTAAKDTASAAKSAVKGAEGAAKKVVKGAEGAAKSVVKGAEGAAKTAVKGAEGAAKTVVKDAKAAASAANNVNINQKKTLPPIDVSKSFNLATANIDCGSIGDIQLKVDAAVKAHADVSLGVVAAGTIIPPKIKTFSLSAGLNADVNGDITFAASASGSPLDTGEIQLFTIGIPGLDIPDVIQIGPAFTIKGRAALDLSIDADLKVAVAYSLKNAAFAFPPNKNLPAQGSPTPKDNPLALSVSPDIAAKGSLSAHLIPELNFGISALGGVAKATVFLNMDSSATLDLTLNGGGTVFSTAVGGSKAKATPAAPAATSVKVATPAKAAIAAPASVVRSAESTKSANAADIATKASSAVDAAATNDTDVSNTDVSTDGADVADDASADPTNVTSPDDSADPFFDDASDAPIDVISLDDFADGASFDDFGVIDVTFARRAFTINGCVDMKLGVDAKVGAEGSFFGLFDASKSFSLFSKEFELFKKCFGNGAARRALAMRHRARSFRADRLSTLQTLAARKSVSLKCPLKKAPKAEQVVNQTVKAGSIKSV